MNDWKDINESDMKIFIGHLILMGIVKKSQIAKYWSRNVLTDTPYFGKNNDEKSISSYHEKFTPCQQHV